ncbi:MAG: DHHA2 domain-containing protein, partial [Methanosarcinales archaeon]
MQKLKEKDNYVLITLMVTDILNEATDLLFVGNKEIIENAFNKKVEKNSVYLEGVLSRKKQVVPPIEKVFKST